MGRINKNIKKTIAKQRQFCDLIVYSGTTDQLSTVDWTANTLTVSSGSSVLYVLTPQKQYQPANTPISFTANVENVVVFDSTDETLKAIPISTFNASLTENQYICGYINPQQQMFHVDIKLRERKNGFLTNLTRNAVPYFDFANSCLDLNGDAYYVLWNDTYLPVTNNTTVPLVAGNSACHLYFNITTKKLEFMTAGDHKNIKNSDHHIYIGFVHRDMQNTSFPTRRTNYQIGFFGDSIWTYQGEIATGNVHYYPTSVVGLVTKSSEMQYTKISNALGKTFINNSWSGSRITSTGATGGINSLDRVQKLKKADGTVPNLVIISQGLNDYTNGVTLNKPDTITTGGETYFDYAYKKLITDIQTLCPGVVIVCTSIGKFNSWQTVDANCKIPNVKGNTPKEFNECIKNIAEETGCIYVDIYNNNGICQGNWNKFYNNDYKHPNSNGQQLMANTIIKALKQEF